MATRNNFMAMAAMMALSGSGMIAEDRQRAIDAYVKRRRNYDIEGPAPEPIEQRPLTRQQRRKLERQAAKRK